MSVLSPLLTVMTAAARKAGKGIARDFGEIENLQVSRKGPSDFVTMSDLKAEGYGFLGEERGMVPGTDSTHRWIVDPIDGTTNLMHSIPHFAISIALEREGRLVAGVVYNPVSDDMYMAETGRGAFRNDSRLRIATRKDLGDCVLATGIPFQGKPGHTQFFKDAHQFTQRVAGIRRFGSASLDLCWVAAGRFDGFWERDLSLWDIAAGVVIVREAGGFCEEINGGDFTKTGSIMAGNQHVMAQMRERLAAAK
jgi:myo-inositol-1(or 4)-monophosphatase